MLINNYSKILTNIFIIISINFLYLPFQSLAEIELAKEDFFIKDMNDNVSEEIYQEIKKTENSTSLVYEKINITLETNRELEKKDLELISSIGCKILGQIENSIFVSVDKKKLQLLSEIDFIKIIRKPSPFIENSLSIEEVGKKINFDKIKKLPYKGKGVKIALIDYGFKIEKSLKKNIKGIYSMRKIDDDITGDGNWKHGTAILEIITKIAPESSVYLINVNKDLDAENILLAIKHAVEVFKVNIVSLSINDAIPKDFFDGTGAYGKRIDKYSKEYGTIFVTAIGNNLRKHYKNYYKPNKKYFHDFKDKKLEFKLKKGENINIVLSWKEDNFNYPEYNFDFAITDKFGRRTFERSKCGKSYKILSFTAEEDNIFNLELYGYHFRKVENKIETSPILEKEKVCFNLLFYSKNLKSIENPVFESSLDPNLAVAKSAIVVGSNKNTKLAFSSWGPGEKNLLKPDFSAPSGVITKSISNFEGSSASVPFISGAIALILSKNPKLNVSKIKNILKISSKNEWNKVIGYGDINIEKCIINTSID